VQHVERLLRASRAQHEWGTATVGGETVRYEVRTVDARSAGRRAEDDLRGGPAGPVVVVVPGHGQTVDGPRKLVAAAALLSRSKIAWCIDPVPCRGGDCTEAQAIAAAARQKLRATFPELQDRGLPVEAILIGWSHGGSEALRAAAADPALFPYYLGLCPTGFVERQPLAFVLSFALEALRVTGRCLRGRKGKYLLDMLRLGKDLSIGLVHDLWRARSLARLVADVVWAGRRVPGPAFPYPGEVLVIWGRHDSLIRWQDVFPTCADPDGLPSAMPSFRQQNLPCARRVEMAVIDGDHVAPEADAIEFVRLGLSWLGQLDEATGSLTS
jgi:pimeloyl-ACP methyl ester carboxylesterase